MALPTNIFLRKKITASTPQTKKNFSTHKPWDHPPSPIVPQDDKNASVVEGQSDSEPKNKLEQSQNKVGTKLEQSQNSNDSYLKQSQNKVRSQLRTQVGTKLEQSQNKVGTNMPFSSVVGLQRRIIFFIFEASKSSRDKVTVPIAIQNLALSCQTTSMAAQVTVRRLEKKGFIHRVEFKDGRGGWTRYELPNDLFQEMLQLESQNKVGTNLEQSQNKVGSQPRTELRTSPPSSSSSLLINNKTTTEEPELFESIQTDLTPEWQTVDYSNLSEIGFTGNHLIQVIKQGKLTPIEVQDSINFFAFDLKRNEKSKKISGAPINFFMGIVRKGIPYAAPDNYESQADEVRRKNLEFKLKKEKERHSEEEKLFELEFEEWRRELTSDELTKLLPEFARRPGQFQDATLRAHYENEILPSRLSQETLALKP